MTSKFGLHNPRDASDGSWDSDTAFFFGSNGSGSGIAASPTPVVSAEAVEAQAAQSGPGGPGSVVAETSGGGLTINLIFDSAAMAAPASFRTGIEQAAALLSSAVSDKITINIKIDYSGTGGGAAAGPDNGQWINYSTVRADLVNNATPGDTNFNALPTGSTIQGQSSVAVWNAQLKLWGLLSANDTTADDGSATFATDIDPNLLVGVALHELTHAMGRVPYGPQPDIFDFYRFTSLGARLFSGSATAPPAYFSLDGGNTKLADYGQTSDSSDFLNSGVQGPNDPFNEFYTSNTLQQLTAVDLKQLDALGFHLTSTTPLIIQTDANTSLVQVGSHYFLDPAGDSTGPELQKNGSPVYVGQFAPWSPIGAIQVSGGYDVAWKNASTGQFIVWATDDSGNRTANLTNGAVAGKSTMLESFETTFHQDLNGDGIIGIPSLVIQTDGNTSLAQVGSHYFLYPVGCSTGPELEKNGSPVYVGQFAPWSPIGAIQVSGGYNVAWKNASTGQFIVWATDDSGNRTANLTNGAVAGNSTMLKSLETTFHQDLNGDGVIGIPQTTSAATVASTSTHSGLTTFDGTTLALDNPSVFNGQIIDFTGDVTLAGSDQIDLHGFNFSFTHSSFDSSTGVLDGSTTASLQFVGGYSQDNFHFANDGNGGTIVDASQPPGHQEAAGAGQTSIATITGQDTFVFAPNFGQISIANFAPATDAIQFSKSVFASISALMAGTHQDSRGNAVITDAAHDTITIQHVTTAQLLAHQSDFHFL